MAEVKIKNIQKQEYTHGAKFQSLELAQEWINAQLSKTPCPWGKPEHQIEDVPAVYDSETGELISEAIMKTVPSEFEVEIIDISAQIEQDEINQVALKFLAETDWKVVRHRDQQELGIATSLTAEEFQDLLQERQMARNSIVR